MEKQLKDVSSKEVQKVLQEFEKYVTIYSSGKWNLKINLTKEKG